LINNKYPLLSPLLKPTISHHQPLNNLLINSYQINRINNKIWEDIRERNKNRHAGRRRVILVKYSQVLSRLGRRKGLRIGRDKMMGWLIC